MLRSMTQLSFVGSSTSLFYLFFHLWNWELTTVLQLFKASKIAFCISAASVLYTFGQENEAKAKEKKENPTEYKSTHELIS